MAGTDILTFVDLTQGGIERHPPLLEWIRSWTDCLDLNPLTPEGWFKEGHGITDGLSNRCNVWIPTHCGWDQMFLWFPAPAVVDAALDELLKLRHKQLYIFHVVVIPRLMTPRWRHFFNKASDFLFVVSPGLSFWPTGMFEPLWVGIVLPFAHCRPWSLKQAPLLVEIGKDLRQVLETGEGDARNILQKLLLLPKRLATLTQCVACGVLHLPGDQLPNASHPEHAGNAWHMEQEQRRKMMEGVEGSHLCIPLQCELCWYQNLEGKDPFPGRNDVYLTCIRQANINSMLGKSMLTIKAHRRKTISAIDNALTFPVDD
jgi:hypothetical protein